jgi:hypothetical protein
MISVPKIAAIAVLVTMGPVMYVMSREHALAAAFTRVHIGDTTEAVMVAMGKPQEESQRDVASASELQQPSRPDQEESTVTEYRYYAWPLPGMWVVGLRDGTVVEKAETER